MLIYSIGVPLPGMRQLEAQVSGIPQSLPRSETSGNTSMGSIGCAGQLSEKRTNLNDDSHEAELQIILNHACFIELQVGPVSAPHPISDARIHDFHHVGSAHHPLPEKAAPLS